jgi:nucleoside-diphosphate-sugar epimerase
MKNKKVLVLGASGAMGKYLVPELCARGYAVDAVSLDEYDFGCNVNRIRAQAKDFTFRTQLLENGYDGIVDFLTYSTHELVLYLPELLEATEHYIFLSSYRVYDGKETPIRETSPRLLDGSSDALLKNSDDYSIHKARGENILRSRERKNWTVVRPSITYSLLRYQLVTLEAAATVGRARQGKPVILPETAKDVQATMSWAGDVSGMIARLLFNERALGETYTLATAEHRTWGEIAGFYRDICGLEAVWVPQPDFLGIAVTEFARFPYTGSWQLVYDRLFDRVIDNGKVLAATGMAQKDLMPLYDGLRYEIGRCPADFHFDMKSSVNLRMDDYLKKSGKMR